MFAMLAALATPSPRHPLELQVRDVGGGQGVLGHVHPSHDGPQPQGAQRWYRSHQGVGGQVQGQVSQGEALGGV